MKDVTVADIRRRLAPRPSQFGSDLTTRARADVDALTAAIDRAKADPTRVTNAPELLKAVADFVPNAFGMAPAGALDQVTRPAVNAFNDAFGTHFGYQPVTDQLLGAAGLIAGGGEPGSAPLTLEPPRGSATYAATLAEAPEAARLHYAAPPTRPPITADRGPVMAAASRVAAMHATGLRESPEAARAPELSPARQIPAPPVVDDWDTGPLYGKPRSIPAPRPRATPDQLAATPSHLTMAPDARFAAGLRNQAARLSDLSAEQQRVFDETARREVIGPFLDDPSYPGHNGATLSRIRSNLADLADQHWSQGGDGMRLAEEIARLSDNLMSTAARQRPEFAEALGGFQPNTPWRAFTRENGLTPDGQQRVMPGQGVFRALNDNDPGRWRVTVPRRAIFDSNLRMSPAAHTIAPEDAPALGAANDNGLPRSTLEAPSWAPSRRPGSDVQDGPAAEPTGPQTPGQ